MTLTAFLAAGISLFCAGFLFGLYVRGGDARRIPEHPSIRRNTFERKGAVVGDGAVPTHAPRPTLRVIDGDYQRPYDQDREWAE